MRITDTQGVQVYLAAQGTDVSSISAIKTAITTAKKIECLQALGDIAATRSSTDYSCMSSDDVVTSLGSMTYSEFNIDVLFDADDASGKKDLIDAFEGKQRRQIIIALSDQPNDAVASSPTFIVFEAAFTAQSYTLAKDSAVQVSTTAKPSAKSVFYRVNAE